MWPSDNLPWLNNRVETKSNGVIHAVWKTPPTMLATNDESTGCWMKKSFFLSRSFVKANDVNWDGEPTNALNIIPFAPLHRPNIWKNINKQSQLIS